MSEYFKYLQCANHIRYVLLMSGLKLDLRPGFNSGLPGLNFGHKFKVDPTWAFPQFISENTKTFLNQQQGKSERRRNSIIWLSS